jgi:hypothetical protein
VSVVGLVLLVLAVVVLQGADGASWLHGPKSQVVHLTKDNFRSLVVESGKAAIVEFYNAQDYTSINSGPIFDVLALDYGGLMTVGVVNMEEEKELTSFFSHHEHNVPFVVLFPSGTISTGSRLPLPSASLTRSCDVLSSRRGQSVRLSCRARRSARSRGRSSATTWGRSWPLSWPSSRSRRSTTATWCA